MIVSAEYEPEYYRTRIVVAEMPATYPRATLWRRATGQSWQTVRGGYDVNTATGGMIIFDYEMPYGVQVTYAITTGTTTPDQPQPDPGPELGPNLAPNGSVNSLDGWSVADPAWWSLALDPVVFDDGWASARSTLALPPPADVDVVDLDTTDIVASRFVLDEHVPVTGYLVVEFDPTVNIGRRTYADVDAAFIDYAAAELTETSYQTLLTGDWADVLRTGWMSSAFIDDVETPASWALDYDDAIVTDAPPLDVRAPAGTSMPQTGERWVLSINDPRDVAEILVGRDFVDASRFPGRIVRALIYEDTHTLTERTWIERSLATSSNALPPDLPPDTAAWPPLGDIFATPADTTNPMVARVTEVAHQATASVFARRAATVKLTLTYVDSAGTVVGDPETATVSVAADTWTPVGTDLADTPDTAYAAVVRLTAITTTRTLDGDLFNVDRVTVRGLTAYEAIATTTIRIPLTGQPVLRDLGMPFLTQPVIVQAIAPISRPGRHGIYEIAGRRDPVVVSDVRSSRRGQVTLLTTNVDQAHGLESLFAAGAPLLLQVPCVDVDFADCYMAITDVETSRWPTANRPGTDRLWTLNFVEVSRPPGQVTAVGQITYAEVDAAYTTYADLLADRNDYLSLALGGASLYPGGL